MERRQTIPVTVIAVILLGGIGAFAGPRSVEIGGFKAIFLLACLALGLNWLTFIPALIARTEKFYDLIG